MKNFRAPKWIAATALAAPLALATLAQPAVSASISASPQDKTVAISKAAQVNGRVSGSGGKVTLQHRTVRGTWTAADTGAVSKAGRFSLSDAVGYYGGHHYRVAYGSSRSKPFTVRFGPNYKPKGSATQWSYLGSPSRWNPCQVIGWKFNPAQGYTGSLGDVKRAVFEISRATGLKFKYQGRTSKVAFRNDPWDAGTELLLSWATPSQVSGLSGSAVGVGGPYSQGAGGGENQIVAGAVALDSTASLRRGYATSGSPTWGQVMVHEIGHAIGLGHAQASDQIMNGGVGSENHRLGNGDLRGMSKVGAHQGCIAPQRAARASTDSGAPDGQVPTLRFLP